ncbi:MAG: YciI family protein [Candidatus Binatia bacterium]
MERQVFLESLLRDGQLLLEGTFGDSGSLMVLEAASTNDALALLQNDPYVLASSRIQIRPLVVNFLGGLMAGQTEGDSRATRSSSPG